MLKDNLLILAFFTVWFSQYGHRNEAPEISTSGSSKQVIQKTDTPPKSDLKVPPKETTGTKAKPKVDEKAVQKVVVTEGKSAIPVKNTPPVKTPEIKATTPVASPKIEEKSPNQTVGTPSILNGYIFEDEVLGKGDPFSKGNKITVHFEAIDPEGNEVLSTKRRGLAYSFKVTEGESLSTLVAGMKVGGQRRILVGPEFVNKGKGMQPILPANTALLIRIWILRKDSNEPGR